MESCSDKGKHLIWAVSLIISITRGGTSHFSSDLSSGRRPKSKSLEKCEVPPLVIEIMRCEVTTFAKKVTHLSEHHSRLKCFCENVFTGRNGGSKICTGRNAQNAFFSPRALCALGVPKQTHMPTTEGVSHRFVHGNRVRRAVCPPGLC
jgi:hypothetical protein